MNIIIMAMATGYISAGIFGLIYWNGEDMQNYYVLMSFLIMVGSLELLKSIKSVHDEEITFKNEHLSKMKEIAHNNTKIYSEEKRFRTIQRTVSKLHEEIKKKDKIINGLEKELRNKKDKYFYNLVWTNKG